MRHKSLMPPGSDSIVYVPAITMYIPCNGFKPWDLIPTMWHHQSIVANWHGIMVSNQASVVIVTALFNYVLHFHTWKTMLNCSIPIYMMLRCSCMQHLFSHICPNSPLLSTSLWQQIPHGLRQTTQKTAYKSSDDSNSMNNTIWLSGSCPVNLSLLLYHLGPSWCFWPFSCPSSPVCRHFASSLNLASYAAFNFTQHMYLVEQWVVSSFPSWLGVPSVQMFSY